MLTRVITSNNLLTQCFHLLIFPCLLKRMALLLIMKTEKSLKQIKNAKIYSIL